MRKPSVFLPLALGLLVLCGSCVSDKQKSNDSSAVSALAMQGAGGKAGSVHAGNSDDSAQGGTESEASSNGESGGSGRGAQDSSININDSENLGDALAEGGALPLGALAMYAYQRAYPQKQMRVFCEGGEWCIGLEGKVFCWADGRFLPQEKLAQKEAFGAQKIYAYSGEPRNPDLYSPEDIAELRKLGTKAAIAAEKPVDMAFTNLLLDGASRGALERRIKKTKLLGFRVNLHEMVVPVVEQIDAEIQALAKTDDEVARFISRIYEIGGYNWRTIDGTGGRRSYHGYGVALDITEANNSKTTYWEWERVWNDNWMLVPQSRLWKPPLKVIQIFERHGFVWGGTWDEYDTMHFEYRPELHELYRLIEACE